jgi:adenylate kinase family enzyme
MKNPLLIVTLGYPGSGKTYFSERLAKEYNLVHLSRDRFRHEAIPNPTFQPEEKDSISRALSWITEEFLMKGVGVLNDGNYNKRKYRNILAKIAKKTNTTYILVHIITPVDQAEKRILQRQKIKSKIKQKYYRHSDVSIVSRIKDETEYPTKSEPVIDIDGSQSFSKQLETFKKALARKLKSEQNQ